MHLDEIQRRSRDIFRLEAADLLRELEAALLELESDPSNVGLIDRVFRVMHTLKGSGATSGFQDLSDFLHHAEEVFTAARAGRLQLDTASIDLTLKLGDAVNRYLAAEPAAAPACLAGAQDSLDALLARLPQEEKSVSAAPPAVAAPTHFRVHFRPRHSIFHSGLDPGMFLDDLRALGPAEIRGLVDELPAFADLDPESCHLHWEATVDTRGGDEVVRSVFMFIADECDLTIGPAAPLAAPVAATRTWYVEFRTTERTLAAPGALEALWLDFAGLGRHHVVTSPPPHDGGIPPGLWRVTLDSAADRDAIAGAFIFLVDVEPMIGLTPFASSTAAAIPSAPPAPSAPRPADPPKTALGAAKVAAHATSDTLRVSAERLDRLVNLVGELVILRSQVSNACATVPSLPATLQGAAEALQSLSTEMRDVVLHIRMMPIEQTFSKFKRLARDLSRDLHKEVDLVIEGAETDMDKTVLDALADPLMHLVRNSLDHGLEPPADRIAAGKSSRGTLRLKAEQRGDRVIVTVGDDGRGLAPEKIRAKAVARGLLAADANPSEAELFQLIFLPGFSTAETVSQVSGRGVGLDVVRRQVEQLRGKVEVRSERGRGAEFRLALPLTLAIIEGLMVEIDGDRYILPLALARETIELTAAQRAANNGRNVVELRGALIPYLNLRDLFACTSAPPDPARVVVVEIEDQRLGLMVDHVIGNLQTVLKSLGWLGQRVEVFSGATVLGDGRVALILDLPALLAYHRRQHAAAAGMEV